jgi:energy-converting hydrogenase Eha subunit H
VEAALALQIPQGTVVQYWWISLAIGVVVIVVVTVLLHILTGAAEQVKADVADIWTGGKLIANNTVHIPLLLRTNQVVDDILDTADEIASATARIQRAVAGDES